MSDVDVGIIGAGPAGISAAIWAQTLKLRFVVFDSGTRPGGQLWRVYNRIADYPGVPSENGASLAATLGAHAADVGVSIRTGTVIQSVDVETGTVDLGGESVTAGFLVLATGVRPRTLGIPGEAEFAGRGVSPSATRDAASFRGRRVVVVGGGDAAFEEALILADGCERVTIVHRREIFIARSDFQARVFDHPRIDVIRNAEVLAVEGRSCVEGLRLRTAGREESLAADGLFVCAGVEPNSSLVAGQVVLDGKGYVDVDPLMRASRARLYAVGDIRVGSSWTIAGAVGDGATAVKDIQRNLARRAGP